MRSFFAARREDLPSLPAYDRDVAGSQHPRRGEHVPHRGAFIGDPTHVRIDEAARVAWQRFLAQAVAFEPAARFGDGAAFADALAELLARHPLPGRLGLRGGPGRLTRAVDVLGRMQPAWVIADRR